MIRPKTLLIFNFGACIAFIVMGFLSTYVIETLLPSIGKTFIHPTLNSGVRKELTESQDLEHIRSQAILYFDLTKELKRVQSTAELRELEAVRYVCYILAIVFAFGGLMLLAVKSTPKLVAVPRPQIT